MMATLYGRSFQRGALLYDFQDLKTDEALESPTGLDFLPKYQCVKTACFTAPSLAVFAKDERWCFLEQFAPIAKHPDSERCGFMLSQRSVRAEALPRAVQPPINLSRRRRFAFRSSQPEAQQLTGLSLSYLVEVIPERQTTAVRVTFLGCAHGDPNGGSSHSVTQRRLLALARGVLKLPEIVQRRRMSAQVPANRWSTTPRRGANPEATATSRCVGCTRPLHFLLMVKKTRCYLCAHFVCSRCWLRQPLETANGRRATVLVCPHCLDSVNRCNYENLAASFLSSQDDGGSSRWTSSGASRSSADCYLRLAQVLPDPEDAREPGHAVVSCLEEALSEQTKTKEDADSGSEAEAEAKTQTAMHVLRLLVNVLNDGANRSESPDLDTPSLQTLQTRLADQVLPLEACVLSNDVTRSYPIDTSGGSNADVVPVGPVPPNESHRLEAIAKDQLLAAGGSDELNLICELATRELKCMASLVTLVGSTHQFVLATDLAPLRGAELPREHTFCQHLLMGDRPMLVQHPEADVRFRNLNPVVHNGVQFYGGFPVFSRDGLSVVGSLCCLDIRPREMTRSQYSTLTQLTRTASKVIAFKGRQACALQRR
ncbi:hypothetical protein BBJ28_00016141 [Nothophytophthora sp. Chile5]|nr:hypothetical protein BBJ28_00016141 [Nothophytophthora sp. Chile5]